MKDFKEEMAAICHDQWAGWMKYLFSKGRTDTEKIGNFIIPKEFVDRWTRQMNTKYQDLTEKEKDSDRIEADKFLKLIKDFG
ncbi:MAG TPA: hypothetical protein VMZ91_07620 [Candidatus Paceibacterota bacterium]|nr:hypothetical protein [Candidatus Paceibacterota bacterium]